jgi:F0F1-type ATP synthase assembly protein I
MRRYLRFATAGTQFAVTIVLLVLGGRWLDGRYPGSEPLFTVLGALLGIGAATYNLIRQVLSSKP